MLSARVAVSCLPALVVLGERRGVRVRWRQVREREGAGAGGPVDAIADHGTVPGVDQLREDRVHHVVVQRPAPTGLVRLTAEGGSFDLEEGTLLDVWLGDV